MGWQDAVLRATIICAADFFIRMPPVERGGQKMIIEAATIKLYAPWVHSLKEKRMAVKSLIQKIKNKFNVSICEADAQDIHQTIVLGLACVAGTVSLADSMVDSILAFIEDNAEAEIIEVRREMR
jgi:uncharacterized protein YlxP (DUF503 family)